MAKGSTSKRRHQNWSAADHAVRKAERERKQQRKKRQKRAGKEGAFSSDQTNNQRFDEADDDKEEETALTRKQKRAKLLSHDTDEKQEEKKLLMHITKVQREIADLRDRLRNWDDAEEEAKARKEEQCRQEEENESNVGKKKKKGRLGPETWKLRGAARPASEVYDFDVRYVDPHLKAHKDAQEKAARSRNLVRLYGTGQFGGPDAPPITRKFLSLLIQLGMLSLQAKKVKQARKAFLECIDLEFVDEDQTPVTPARYQLMRLYLEANRPDSARRLSERIPWDGSCWIRFSAALIEYVSWKLLEEKGSTEAIAEAMLWKAVQANIFCAFYLAFHSEFSTVMEYTSEIQDAECGGLEEAIEYCCSEQFGAWAGSDGALDWLRTFLLNAMKGKLSLETGHALDWEAKLVSAEKKWNTEGSERPPDEDPPADFAMFAGMFRTTMEMLQAGGKI